MADMLWTLVFALVAGGLVGLVHLYVYRRLVRDTTRSTKLRRAALSGAALVLVLFVVTRFFLRGPPPPWFVPLSTLVWFWSGFSIYLVLCFGSVDIAGWAQRLAARVGRRSVIAPDPVSPERRLFVSLAVH